jgi:hypothetical protein
MRNADWRRLDASTFDARLVRITPGALDEIYWIGAVETHGLGCESHPLLRVLLAIPDPTALPNTYGAHSRFSEARKH